MNTIYDRGSVAHVHDPHLRTTIERRLDELGDLMAWTEILVIEPGDTEDDIIKEAGFSPLVEPLDGIRFGSKGFQPFWDYLIDWEGWFELSVSFGSSFAYIIFIADADGIPLDLRGLCRTYAGT